MSKEQTERGGTGRLGSVKAAAIVVETDFGRLGIQTCYAMGFDDHYGERASCR